MRITCPHGLLPCVVHPVCTAFVAIKSQVRFGSFVGKLPFWFLKTLKMKCVYHVDMVALFAFHGLGLR